MPTKGTVGARELKTRLGKYLRIVRAGRTLIITERGEPVAELAPVGKTKDPNQAAWERLAAEGKVTLPIRKLQPFEPLVIPGVSLSDAVREDRDEGY